MAEDRSDARTRDKGWFGRGNQAAWIGAAGVLLAALVGVAVPLLRSSGDDTGAAGGGAAPTAPATAPVVQAPATKPPSPSPSPSPSPAETSPPAEPSAAGSERWHGTVAFGDPSKELDEGQPTTSYYQAGDLEVGGWRDHYDLTALGDAVLSLWSGDGAALPGYQDCASTVDAEGVASYPLAKGMVVCVRTSEGNVARLTLTSLPAKGSRATFDAVIWNAG
ncbi:hypothetical protein [Streptomyces sp. NPDC051677]|uniref:hypothetical protein n=1 Tax=Streptomyces sp. NPDC051677 TaxID=3365669 RepID=UPI0037D6F345